MNSLWNNWAVAYRNKKAFFALVSVAGILLWALYTKPRAPSSKLVRSETVAATVREVKSYTSKPMHTKYGVSQGHKMARAVLILPDGNKIVVRFIDTMPREGEKVPILVNHYRDGSKKYFIDRLRWLSSR
jgi:tryptophan synthase alpha subunit